MTVVAASKISTHGEKRSTRKVGLLCFSFARVLKGNITIVLFMDQAQYVQRNKDFAPSTKKEEKGI